MLIWIITTGLIGYSIGCLHGSILAQWISGVNIKNTGVKNAGASNATIVLGKKFGALVAAVDIGKGVLAVILVRMLAAQWMIEPEASAIFLFVVSAATIAGHNFPFYMKFNGGKGTATLIGVLFGLDWRFGLIGLALFIIVSLLTDFLVFGVLMLYMTLFVAALFAEGIVPIFIAIMLLAIAIWKHVENLQRIKARTENRVSSVFKRKK